MIKFEYPYTGSVDSTLDLENPLIGDSDTYRHQINTKKNMSGQIITYIRGPIQIAKALNFESIPRAQALALLDFVEAYGSEYLKYTDYDGLIWKIKILTNPVEVVTESKGDFCSANLEIEGEQIV
jgi:hypothetical protein